MKKSPRVKPSLVLSALIMLMIGSAITLAQTPPSGIGPAYYPPWYTGYTPTPREWQVLWSNKMDASASNGCPITLGCTGATTAAGARTNLGAVYIGGDTMTGKLTTVATSASAAGLNLPHGTAPSVPVNGDVWTTTTGLYARINGTTATYLAVGTPLGEKLTFIAPTTGTASANFPHGVAPTTPADGDMWSTTAGLYMRVSGTTWGPFFAGGNAQTVKLTTLAAGTGSAGLNLPHGTAPSSPANGDVWTTTGGLYYQINGATWGPVFAGGQTQTAKLTTLATGTGGAGLNLPHGTAPSSPVNGDIWTTSAGGLYVRINGTTLGPYVSPAGATFTGKITTATAGLNVPHGANGSPANGDIWTESTGLYVRVNGVTVGPYVAESGGQSQTANTIFAAPNGSSGAPSFRALVAADLPTGNGLLAFGDGSDGANNCTGSQTLTKDVYYTDLTIGASCALTTAGYRVHVSGTLTFSGGTIGWDGANGENGVAGGSGGGGGNTTAGLTSAYLGGSATSGSGGNGGTGAGGNAFGSGFAGHNGGSSGNGGNGGAGTAAAGTGGTGESAVYKPIQPNVPFGVYMSTGTAFSVFLGGSSGPGGGAGGGNNAAIRGGGGGGGGVAGGTVFIAALNINRTGLTASDIVARGGNGGTGGNGEAGGNSGGGGGGAGGGGGDVIIVYRNVTGSSVTNAIDVSGGNGAQAGNGSGTGGGGTGGRAGYGGRVMIYDLGTGTLTTSAPTTPPAAGTPSGTTGGGQTTNSRLVNF